MQILDVKNVTMRFGGLTAVNNVSFEVTKGNIHGLIGPNGAGKSTLFKIIAGFLSPTSGQVIFDEENITNRRPHFIAASGVVRTFQETTLFHEMTVYDNVLIGVHNEAKTNVFASLLRIDRVKQANAAQTTEEMLYFMGLNDRRDQLAAELPLGLQRVLAVAISLASKPRLLLMDEPFAGMNPEETRQMMKLTHRVRESGVTIILVEHNMKAVMGLCDQLTVLNFGSVLDDGSPERVRTNPNVIQAYLGGN